MHIRNVSLDQCFPNWLSQKIVPDMLINTLGKQTTCSAIAMDDICPTLHEIHHRWGLEVNNLPVRWEHEELVAHE